MTVKHNINVKDTTELLSDDDAIGGNTSILLTSNIDQPDLNIDDDNKSPSAHRQQSAPSLTRRMSSQFLYQLEKQRSVVDSMGNITDTANSLLPDAIAQNIPGLNRKPSQLKPTYFCNICFTKYPIDEGFILSNCQHQFCAECIKGFMESKIKNGIINLTCFYPIDDSKLNLYISAECKDRL